MHMAVMATFLHFENSNGEAIASTTCVEVKKEALARRILQVRQLLTPPGTCLIDNATLLNAMYDALLP